MAKINPILGSLRGSIAGNTFSHNKGGDYVRGRTGPTNPNTTRQQGIRNIMAAQSSAWYSLTDEQRETWNTWASGSPLQNPLGNTYYLTGHQAFVGLNSRLVDAGISPQTSPPASTGPDDPLNAQITFVDGNTIALEFEPDMDEETNLQVWMSKPQSGAGNPNMKQAVILGYSAQNVASPIQLELPMAVGDGNTVNFWVAIMDKYGQVGVAVKIRETYTAA